MNAKARIARKVAQVYGDNCPNVFKGYTFEGNGWHYQPFGREPIFLGKSLDDARRMLREVEEYREEVRAGRA